MSPIRRQAAAACLLMLVQGCEKRPPAPAPEEAAQARRTIVQWLECEECREGELDSVVKLAATAVPTLTSTLLEGPSPAKREEQRTHLTDLYQQQQNYARSHPQAKPRVSEAEFLKVYSDNLVARYRTRSALALERIGGSAAAAALKKALSLPLREDERAVIGPAAKRLSR